MADHYRYSWLDEDAAERLLRGEPVEAHRDPGDRGDQARTEVERLAGALRDIAAASRPPDGPVDDLGPLPGEEAAVAAFRAARDERAESTSRAGGSGRADLPRVREAGPVRSVRRTSPMVKGGTGSTLPLRRPLRAGVVLALAGCALGGVAMAAGTGVIPFGDGGGDPRPMISMPGTGPAGGSSTSPHLTHDDVTPSDGRTDRADNDANGGVSGEIGGAGTPTGAGEETEEHQAGQDGQAPSGAPDSNLGGTWAKALCVRYVAARDGQDPEVDRETLHKLEDLAGGSAAVRGYCAEVLDSPGGEDTGAPGGGGDHGAPPPPDQGPTDPGSSDPGQPSGPPPMDPVTDPAADPTGGPAADQAGDQPTEPITG